MNTCCLAVIDRYRLVWGGQAEGAALYCKECTTRLELHEGIWGTAP